MFQIDSLSGILTIGGALLASSAFCLAFFLFFKQRSLERSCCFFSGKKRKDAQKQFLSNNSVGHKRTRSEIQELFDALEAPDSRSQSLHKRTPSCVSIPFKGFGSNQASASPFWMERFGCRSFRPCTHEGRTRVYAKPILKSKRFRISVYRRRKVSS